MTRRDLLKCLAAPLAAQQPRRPNFIVIYTDDQGIGDMGCYGSTDLKTPNMDRLAAAGVRFGSWYSNSPVCSPSRAALLTGLYPQRAGIPEILFSKASFDVPGLAANQATLPRELGKLGYRTSCVGKWHLGSVKHSQPMAQGFDEFFGFYSGWTDGFSHRYYSIGNPANQVIYHDLWRNEKEVWEDPSYHTEIFTREAKAFVARQSAARPFFLYLAYGAPHYPMIAPAKYLERFPESMDRDRRMYGAMIAAVDDGLGEILDQLKESGLERDTVIFFQSDNGATAEVRADHAGRSYRGGSNKPYRGFKGGLFEGGIRMPALMSWPGHVPAGAVINEMGAAMDIMPTFLKWAGGASPAADGKDVSEMIQSGGKSPHESLFWEYKGQRAVRKGHWKLMDSPRTELDGPMVEKLWLSNLRDDPAETRNWAAAAPAVVRELEPLLRREPWANK